MYIICVHICVCVFWKYCPGKTVEAMLERSTPGGREAPQEAPAVAIQTGEECVS